MVSRIKIAFYTDSVNEKLNSPMVLIFYYKVNSAELFYKEITFNIEDLRKQNSESSIDHLEKNFETYEKILYYSQYKSNREDILNIFKVLIGDPDDYDKDTVEFVEKRNELLNSVRRTKIKNFLKDD